MGSWVEVGTDLQRVQLVSQCGMKLMAAIGIECERECGPPSIFIYYLATIDEEPEE